MLKRWTTLSVLGLALAGLLITSKAADEAKVAAIKEVIREAYIEGVHINRDADAMRAGFHPEFRMMVYRDDQIDPVSIDQWSSSVEKGRKENPNRAGRKVEHEFSVVDVTGNAAVARVEVMINGKHVYTDYLSLYEFNDGWKIVGKIFYSH